MTQPLIRPASKGDSLNLAYLINLAGEGIPSVLWGAMGKPGDDILETGQLRAERDEGGFSYRNAHVICLQDNLLGMLLGYRQLAHMPGDNLAEVPDFLQPILELEGLAPGSWYLNALAVYERFHGRGIGSRLLAFADEVAYARNCRTISAICANGNKNAMQLYRKQGYKETESRHFIPYSGCRHHSQWVLLLKDL